MSQEEQDMILGRLVREQGNLEREATALCEKMRAYGVIYKAAASAISYHGSIHGNLLEQHLSEVRALPERADTIEALERLFVVRNRMIEIEATVRAMR